VSRLENEYSDNQFSELKTEEDAFAATDLILKVRQAFKEVDAKRKERTAPANETIRLINSDYKNILTPLKKIEDELKEKIEEYGNKKIDADLKHLEKMRKTTKDKSLMMPIGLSTIPSALGEIRFRKGYSIKVIDEKKVPKKYFTIDTKLIEKDIDAGDNVKIPGVEIVQTTKAAIYAK
jgi:signal recognition particle subunit SEC65